MSGCHAGPNAAGDRSALERVAAAVRDPIYRLALRMLSDPHDAEDCAQDILILVVTHLGPPRPE